MNDSQRPLAPVHIGSPRAVSGFAQVDHEWSPEPLEAQNGLGLLDYWQLLKRRRRTALLCLVLGASAGFLFSLPQTPVYRAQVTLEIQGLNREYMGLQDVTPTESGVGGFLGVDIGTQVDLLQSRILLDKAVEKLTPSDYATRGDDLSRILAWRKFLGFPEAGDKERWRDTLEGIRESLKVASFRNSRIVRASVDSTDVAIASDFANALAEAFITENIEARWAATQYTEDWVERQLEDLKIKLEKSEDELQAYAHASGLVFTSEQGSIAVEQLRNLQEDLGAGRAERIARQSTYELVSKYPEASLESAHQQELAALHHDLAALQSIYTDDFPKVRAVKARIREVVRSIKVERDRILDQLKSEYDTALRRESLLQADYRHQAALVSEEARKSIQYNILRREVETSRQLYDNLLQKGKEARLSAALLRSPIRVVDPATPPASPIRPNHLLNTALGLGLGGFLGVVLIIIRERADRRIKEPGDAEFFLGAPELGMIPLVEISTNRSSGVHTLLKARRGGKPVPSTVGLRRIGVRSALSQGVELVAWNQSKSVAAESFQSALTSLMFAGGNGSIPRRVVVTSSVAGEGKSTLVSNLAACLAMVHRRPLVIDADLRRPHQHEVFGVENDTGLANILGRPGPFAPAFAQRAVKNTAVPYLDLMPSGGAEQSVSNLLHSPRTIDVLNWASQNYDCVLIDTPPVGHLSDARLLGRLADAVILVIRLGVTTRRDAMAALKRFRNDGTQVLGFVLNGYEPTEGQYGYYAGYYSHGSTAPQAKAG